MSKEIKRIKVLRPEEWMLKNRIMEQLRFIKAGNDTPQNREILRDMYNSDLNRQERFNMSFLGTDKEIKRLITTF